MTTQTMENIAQSSAFKPAERVSAVREYYFSRKLREIARLNAEGRDIISLGIGSPDRMPPAEAIDTLCEQARRPEAHGYQPYTGIAELRKAMSRFYSRHYGVTLDPDNEIQPLIGSKEGILHISLAFLNPGDAVLIPDPGYPTYSSVSRLVGAETITYSLTEEGGWEPDFESLERLPLDRVKLMWVNYPHMPTGRKASLRLFERLVDFGRRHDIVIAHDNPYSFILNDSPLSILQVDGAKDVAIEMNSMSKSHNMAGWRIGMLASNPMFIQWVLRVKSNIDSGQFRPMMLAAAEALDSPDSWYDDINKVYRRRRVIAEQIFDHLGCRFDPEATGMFLWGRIPDGEPSSESMSDRVLDNCRVFITPGFIFGSNGERYVRLSLCATEEKLSEALRRIKKNYKTNE